MKRTILAFFLIIISVAVSAQNRSKTIKVVGQTLFMQEVELYKVKLHISRSNYYDYSTDDKPSLQEIEKSYFSKMKELGFPESKFKKSKDIDNYNNYTVETSIYIFETGSSEEFHKFLKTKPANGVLQGDKLLVFKPMAMANRRILFQAAIKDAASQAAMLADTMGKKVGNLVAITDLNSFNSELEDHYYYSLGKKTVYNIQAEYELKD